MLETVKCPYCGADMEEGVIQSSQEIAWLKEKAIVGASWLNEGAVQLAPFPALKGRAAVRAWLCRDCRKVIIDY